MLRGNFEKKASFTFYQILIIGLAPLVLIAFLSARLYPELFLLGKSFFGRLKTICGCANYLSFTDQPILFSLLMLLGLVFTVFFCFALIKILRFRRSTTKFIKIYLKNKRQIRSPRLDKVARGLKLENKIVEVKSQRPTIFCFGLIGPKICVSSGLIEKFSDKELKIVLRHEQHHLKSNEPIRIFLVRLTAAILFFLPGLESLVKQYSTFSELAADEWATDGFKDRVFLASALYKVIRWKKQAIAKNGLALSFFASPVIEERVNKLIDNGYKPKFKVFSYKLSLGIFILFFFFIVLNGLFSLTNPVMAGDGTGFCLSAPATKYSQQREMPPDKSVCHRGDVPETSWCGSRPSGAKDICG